MNRAVHVVATFQSKSGKERESETILRGLIEPSLRDEGCVHYTLYRRMDRPGLFYFVEEWKSAADFRKHTSTPHLTAVMERKEELFETVDLAFVSPVR